MAFWWVNQKQTWRHEIPGEYLWSPKLDRRGRHLEYYDNMTHLAPRDIVFSYIGGLIQYVGVVVRPAETSRRPDFGFAATTQWTMTGGRWKCGICPSSTCVLRTTWSSIARLLLSGMPL